MQTTRCSSRGEWRAATIAVLVVLSLVAGATATAAAGGAGPDASLDAERSADVDPALLERHGVVEAVVRFPEAPAGASVEHRKRHAERSQSALRSFAAETDGVTVERRFWLTNAAVVSVDTGTVSPETLANVEGATRVHPNYRGDTLAAVSGSGAASDDPASPRPRQSRQGEDLAYGIEAVGAPAVWDFYDTRGEGTAVAVLDTGVDPAGHDGIRASLSRGGWAEFDPRTGERVDSEPNDPDGHGTSVSGIVAGGRTDDGTAYGVAPETALYHGKVGGERKFSFASITAGMQWAVENDVDVVSLSLGPLRYGSEFAAPVENARSSGIVVVGAIGNAGRYTSAGPGNLPTVVGVGAVAENRSVPAWSGGERVDTRRYWGEDAPSSWEGGYTVPEVTAPGVGVVVSEPGGEYATGGGASYAAPHAAGAAALVAAATGAEGAELEDALVGTARHPDELDSFAVASGPDPRNGAGSVNALAAASRLTADEQLSGVVTTADGEPIAGALVISETGPRTRTDSDGRYTLSVPAGEQPVGVLAVGRENGVEVVNPAATDGQDFQLATTEGPGTALVDPLPTRVDPGEPATATFETRGADAVTVEADVEGPLTRDDLTLRVDGEPAPFGEPVVLDEMATARPVTFEVEPDSDVPPGAVDTTVRFSGDSIEESGQLERLYVHPDPLRLGPDLPVSLDVPVGLAAPGTTVVLGDGTYEAGSGETAALTLDRPVSIVAAEGADPTIDGTGTEATVLVTANDVELRGLTIDGNGAERTVQVGIRTTDRASVAPSGVAIADNRIRGGTDGVVSYGAPALWVDRNRVSAERNGVHLAGPQPAAIRGNEIDGAGVSVRIEGIVTTVADNRIAGADTGIVLEVPTAEIEAAGVEYGSVEANTVDDSAEGLRIVGEAPAGAVGDNEFRNVDDQRVSVEGGENGESGEGGPGPAGANEEGDSVLGVVLYAAAGASVALLFVPYGLRRFRRR